MTLGKEHNGAAFNRGTGLLVIDVRHSNPNGDPDAESEPRTLDDERGLISPVSFKRKLRDLVGDKDGSAWEMAKRGLQLDGNDDERTILLNTRRGLGHPTERKVVKAKYQVLETRFREREKIKAMNASDFAAEFWDARLFGNTFLESLSEKGEETKESESGGPKKGKKSDRLKELEKRDHFISTGVVQFGPGISVAPIEVIRATFTNKAGVEEGKDRGMAPLALRIVRHGVYLMPFFVNPCAATKTGCGLNDLRLMQFLIPHAYRLTASMSRPQVEVRHAWYAEHKSPLGSCPDFMILDALRPTKTNGSAEDPTASIDEYVIPTQLPSVVRDRLEAFEDLCAKQWV